MWPHYLHNYWKWIFFLWLYFFRIDSSKVSDLRSMSTWTCHQGLLTGLRLLFSLLFPAPSLNRSCFRGFYLTNQLTPAELIANQKFFFKSLNAVLARTFLSQHLSCVFSLSMKLKAALSSEASPHTAASGVQWLPWSYGMDRWPFGHSRYSSKNIQLDFEERRMRRHSLRLSCGVEVNACLRWPYALSVTHANHMTLNVCSCWQPANAARVGKERTSTASKEGSAHQQCC